MTRILLSILMIMLGSGSLLGNGVAIVDAENGDYLQLVSSYVDAVVENQVSIVTAENEFRNDTGTPITIKYAYPIPLGASATGLRWTVNNVLYEANIEPTEQDTLGGSGSDVDPNLITYLGAEPLYFDIEQTILPDSILHVELSYVQLLPYEFGEVTFYCPNDYRLIQDNFLWGVQSFNLTLNSARSITTISCPTHPDAQIEGDANTATVTVERWESIANTDYVVVYSLSLDELGLYGFSTFLPDSVIPDDNGQGFLAFIAEPDPSENTQVIEKVFTLIIDKSGSMGGSRIFQARAAASFIVEHLNEGDYFNIITFSSEAEAFASDHVPLTDETASNALEYIDGILAGGSTNISGAFDLAIPQFVGSDASSANIIIFFTDGEATMGITETGPLVAHVGDLIDEHEVMVSIFSFGIGSSIDQQLLTLLAAENNGLAEFLGNDELEERITEFYLRIRNPVLLETEMEFSPDLVYETYPAPLPNLYQGQQLVVAGRYDSPNSLDITLAGMSFSNYVEYSYPYVLAGEALENYSFLPKFWAKMKIENLLVQYYSLDPDSPEAEDIEDQIIEISVQFGVITPFTSYVGGDITDIELEDDLIDANPQTYRLLGNYPNPFNGSTTIQFEVGENLNHLVHIRIYNSLGQLVRDLQLWVNRAGLYAVSWDGLLANGLAAPSDQYVYVIDLGNRILSGKMTLIK